MTDQIAIEEQGCLKTRLGVFAGQAFFQLVDELSAGGLEIILRNEK